MKEITKPAIVLLLITAIAAAILGLVYDVTKDTIEAQKNASQNAAMQEVFPDGKDFTVVAEAPSDTVAAVYEATDGSNVIGYVMSITPSGFGGVIEAMVGISADGNVTGLRILTHSETPGLGAKATEPEFYEQFAGKAAPVDITKNGGEIQAITGATITSSAVISGVNAAYDWIAANGGAN